MTTNNTNGYQGGLQMKKFAVILMIAAFLSVVAVNAFAEGDKNHGDIGKGKVKRVMVNK